jgi:hypothetical protein
MSIAGYLIKRGNTELRMPKSGEPGKGNAGPSIRYEGPVLTGQKSVEQEQRDDAIRATSHLVGESYSTVENYDPVLQAHCRLEPKLT